MKTNQKGFSAIEAILVVVVVGLLGAAGWLVYDRQQDKEDNTSQSSSEDSDSASGSVKTIDGIKYTVPEGWQNAKGPFADSELGDGYNLLSPDYKEAGGGQLFIDAGAFISFGRFEWDGIESDSSEQEAADIIKNSEGTYLDSESVEVTTIAGKQVVMYDSGHTTDGVTVLYKTADKAWLEASFSTVAGDSSDYTGQQSPHYPTFTAWLEEFLTLNK